MHSLLRATILLGRVKHHFDKLRQNEWFKIQVTSLFRVGVREFEICGRVFKVRFAPSSTSTPYSLQNSLSTLLLIVLTWNLAITPSKCLSSIAHWKHSEIWLCSWDMWDDTLLLQNSGNLLVMMMWLRLGRPRWHRMTQRPSSKCAQAQCPVTFWQGAYQAMWVPWVCAQPNLVHIWSPTTTHPCWSSTCIWMPCIGSG